MVTQALLAEEALRPEEDTMEAISSFNPHTTIPMAEDPLYQVATDPQCHMDPLKGDMGHHPAPATEHLNM